MGFIWFYGYPRRSRTHPLSSSQWCGPCPLLPFLLEWHSLQRWMVEKEKLKHVPDECDFKVLQLNSGCCSFCHVSSCMWATKLNAIILSFARCTYLSLYLLVIPVFWTASPSLFGEPGLTDSLLWRDALTSGCPSAEKVTLRCTDSQENSRKKAGGMMLNCICQRNALSISFAKWEWWTG